MPKDQISQTPNPTLFAEDSLVSRSPTRENSLPKTTPAISGLKCLELSGSSGPLGLLEKMLLGSSAWAWTKYSLTWKPKATPQGRLIFQLARLAPRTSDNESGLLHTPTAKANQTSPSMVDRGQGNWVSSLGGAKPHHMVPTPTTMDHIERKSTNLTPSTGKLNYETNKSVSLDRWARMWPTPDASMGTGGRTFKEGTVSPTGVDLRTGRKRSVPLNAAVKMWQTPMVDDARGGGSMKSRHIKLHQQVKMWPTTDPKTTGSLNPQWVAWLMGYPTEYLSCVHWETQSSRKSRNK
jgi:hypothetical protein